MEGPDQAAYLRFVSTLGLDSEWLKKASGGPLEQAIGFIAFSRLHDFLTAQEALDIKFQGLTGYPQNLAPSSGVESGTSCNCMKIKEKKCVCDSTVTVAC
ncbi:hypothetical protein [Hoeflea sp. IMCC20628]|uniref:hypothetical protein n=1 Tax=Hoeflea sp. IMCC20628 TaxID=1620421 RepID=UPI0012E0B92B|nr:hypothetical protein [Hoeflea sp. IMCC20628]